MQVTGGGASGQAFAEVRLRFPQLGAGRVTPGVHMKQIQVCLRCTSHTEGTIERRVADVGQVNGGENTGNSTHDLNGSWQ